MIVGGPNTRSDFHVEEGEEWFLQLKGSMLLQIVDGEEFRNVVIGEGETFLLPGGIPHSPQRYPDSFGLVIERRRLQGELDGLRWYCPACNSILHQQFFVCQDLGSQLGGVITDYYADVEKRTCEKCHAVDLRPEPINSAHEAVLKDETLCKSMGWQKRIVPDVIRSKSIDKDIYPDPRSLFQIVKNLVSPSCTSLFGEDAEFQIKVRTGVSSWVPRDVDEKMEIWLYQIMGASSIIHTIDGSDARTELELLAGQCFLCPAVKFMQWSQESLKSKCLFLASKKGVH